jgi:nitrite reductase/ring-hydroxylating ferredoxin subunit
VTALVFKTHIKHVRQVKGSGVNASGTLNFTSPFAEGRDVAWSFAAELAAIPQGGVLARRIAGEPVILSRIDRAVSCFRDACSHLDLPISDGKVSAGRIKSRHHGFEYDLTSGECLTAPKVQ